MAAFGAIVGEMLVETGHALQRLGLRASGKNVKALDRFRSAGVLLPELCNSVKVDPSTTIIGGRCIIKGGTSIGANSVICAEPNKVFVGFDTTIGDDVVINASIKPTSGLPAQVIIADEVEIGNGAILQSCLIGDQAKIGENSVIGEGAFVEPGAELAPGSVVLPGYRIPAKELWGGNPAKYIGPVNDHH